uniref:Uncharacterized protein n=1 Tax=Bionectria ochroleuca TaxID=29856 RepID=A0A8H7TU12_BIOOC
MEVFKKKGGSWAEDAILKTAVGVAAASKQAAKIVDGVDWQDVRAKIEGAASSAQESIESAYQYTEDTFNDNPKLFYTAAGVVTFAAAAPLAMPAVLGAAGFSSIGPVAGSMAAGLQSAGWAGGLALCSVQSRVLRWVVMASQSSQVVSLLLGQLWVVPQVLLQQKARWVSPEGGIRISTSGGAALRSGPLTL